MLKKTLTAATVAGAVLLGSAGVASAHECFVVNRSSKGAIGADHSANWENLALADLFASAHLFLRGPAPLTPEQVDEAVAMAVAAGLPAEISFFEQATIPRGAPATTTSDLKGVDHFDDHVQLLAGIYFSFFEPVG